MGDRYDSSEDESIRVVDKRRSFARFGNSGQSSIEALKKDAQAVRKQSKEDCK